MAKKSKRQELLKQAWELYQEEARIVDIADFLGLPYSTVFMHIDARRDGFKSTTEHRELRATEKGFKSNYDYEKQLREARKQKLKYRELSRKINSYLARKKITIAQLAREAGVSRQSMSYYMEGSHYPEKNTRLLEILGINY